MGLLCSRISVVVTMLSDIKYVQSMPVSVSLLFTGSGSVRRLTEVSPYVQAHGEETKQREKKSEKGKDSKPMGNANPKCNKTSSCRIKLLMPRKMITTLEKAKTESDVRFCFS